MESNNIIAAPQNNSVEELYSYWQQNHVGSMRAFYEFLTVPSIERDEFMRAQETSPFAENDIVNPVNNDKL